MSKPSPLQREVILAIKNELDYWLESNDIHSPSHHTSCSYEMLENIESPLDADEDDRLDSIGLTVSKLWAEVAHLSECHIRKQQMKDFKP